jgi:hypothetical protein
MTSRFFRNTGAFGWTWKSCAERPWRKDNEFVGDVQETANVFFELGADVDVRLVQEGASTSRFDLASDLTSHPGVLARVAHEDKPFLISVRSCRS